MAFRDLFKRKKKTPEEKRKEFLRDVPKLSAELTVKEIAAKQKKARQEAEKAEREKVKARQQVEKIQREREKSIREAKREASGVKVIAAKPSESGVKVIAFSGGEKLKGTLRRKTTRKGDSRTTKKKKPNERTKVIGAR